MNIVQLELQATELLAQRRFYQDLLRLPTEMSGRVLSVQAGTSQLIFRQSPGNQEQRYHFAFNVPENQFEEAAAWIARRLPLVKSSTGESRFDFRNWNAHSCYFLDPAGNILEFIARHGLSNGSASPFNEQGILCISEVGVATDDVRATAELLRGLPLPIYDGEGSDAFVAMGDENGLLIVVKHGRTWFPDTGVPAGMFPLAVTMSTVSDAKLTLSGPPYQLSHT